MGYDTWYNVNVSGVDADERMRILEEISEAVYGDKGFASGIEDGFTARWYDNHESLKAVAARHPAAVIEVFGDGESSDDIWAARYRGDESEEVRYDGLPAFRDVLTPREEDRVFDDARERYLDARREMAAAAGRRIRAVKARITGREDCHLLLNPERRFTISATSPVTGARVPATVTGVHDDGEGVTTTWEPVFLNGMEDGDIAALVACVEDIEKDIKAGRLHGRYDEEDDWFVLAGEGGPKQEDLPETKED